MAPSPLAFALWLCFFLDGLCPSSLVMTVLYPASLLEAIRFIFITCKLTCGRVSLTFLFSYILSKALLACSVQFMACMVENIIVVYMSVEPLWGFEHSPLAPSSQRREQVSTVLECQVLQYDWLQGTVGKLKNEMCVWEAVKLSRPVCVCV